MDRLSLVYAQAAYVAQHLFVLSSSYTARFRRCFDYSWRYFDLFVHRCTRNQDVGKKSVSYKYLLAGAVSGAISRTLTAPLDRMRVFLQISSTRNHSLISTAKTIWKDGGILSFWRGNGLSLVKIIPESATRFFVYERCKRYLHLSKQNYGHSPSRSPSDTQIQLPHALKTSDRLIAGSCHPITRSHTHFSQVAFIELRLKSGGIAGLTSQVAIYPLETVKTRVMSEVAAGNYVSAWTLAAKMFKTGGFRIFFRGLTPSLIG